MTGVQTCALPIWSRAKTSYAWLFLPYLNLMPRPFQDIWFLPISDLVVLWEKANYDMKSEETKCLEKALASGEGKVKTTKHKRSWLLTLTNPQATHLPVCVIYNKE